jgi:hypothetical protein
VLGARAKEANELSSSPDGECHNGTETGRNATLHEPISADGTSVIGKTYTVPPGVAVQFV